MKMQFVLVVWFAWYGWPIPVCIRQHSSRIKSPSLVAHKKNVALFSHSLEGGRTKINFSIRVVETNGMFSPFASTNNDKVYTHCDET